MEQQTLEKIAVLVEKCYVHLSNVDGCFAFLQRGEMSEDRRAKYFLATDNAVHTLARKAVKKGGIFCYWKAREQEGIVQALHDYR